MNRDPSSKQCDVDAFADVVRQVRAPLSARQRSAGWQRLRQALVSRRALPDENPSGWWPRRRLRLGLAFALVAILGPVGWLSVKRAGPQPLRYVVSRDSGIGASGAAGGVLSAQTGRVQLLFTDGSRIGMRIGARLTVAALTAKGSDIRLLDGIIDVDVRHQPDTAWTFEAGPYAVHVRGTSFALGWNVTQRRLELRMRSGTVAVAGPGGLPPFAVVGGESVFLDDAGNPLPRADLRDAPAEASAANSPSSQIGTSTQVAHADRNRKVQDHRQEHRQDHLIVRTSLAHAEWAPLLARGDFDAIVEQAKRSGIDVCLGSDTEQNLAALADAARYTHRRDLAQRSLVALRARFPSTDRARDAAFFLARLSESTSGGVGEALSWYERYLREAAGGSYAEEALGREMILLRRNDQNTHARDVAGRYLKAYPHGAYANEAAGLLAEPSVP